MRSEKLNQENSVCFPEKQFEPKSQDDSSIRELEITNPTISLADSTEAISGKLTAKTGFAILTTIY